jgi:hypothetical protein
MDCELTLGRKVPCKDAIGGIDKLFFLNYQEYDITEAGGVVSEINEADGVTPATAYEYVLRDSVSGLTQNINSSRDNGTTWIEQVITAQMQVVTAIDNEELMLLIYGRPLVVVQDKRGKYWLAGRLRGCDVSGGNSTLGAAMGDLNGYTLTITGMENKFAPEVTSVAMAALTIVTAA